MTSHSADGVPPTIRPEPVDAGPSARELSEQLWARVRAATPSRVGLGRRGDSLPVSALLDLREAHAIARDAIHLPLDVEELCAEIGETPALAALGAPVRVQSRAVDRSTYLRRPDLGRRLDPGCRVDPVGPAGSGQDAELPTLAIVIADGLSTAAVAAHGVPMADALVAELNSEFRIAPLVVASQARVAIGDEVGAQQGVDEVIVLIGERPGLSVSDSLGGYLTHRPRLGRRDSERNCVSNIRPGGLSFRVAAATLARLARGAMELGGSGVRLKDTGGRIETVSPQQIGPRSGQV